MHSFSFSYHKRRTLVGLDIRADELVLTCLRPLRVGWQVQGIASAALPSGIIIEGNIVQVEPLVTILKKLVLETRALGLKAAIALPDSAVIERHISFPRLLKEEEYEAEIHMHLHQYLEGVTEEMYFDYFLEKKNTESHQAILIAAKRDLVNRYLDVSNQSGLIVKIVDVEKYALARVIHFLGSSEIVSVSDKLNFSKEMNADLFLKNIKHSVISVGLSLRSYPIW